MKLDIKELGYVKSVQLDLDKDLTILCGPNNTGKTYVAYAIYGLMKFRSELPKSKKVEEEVKNLLDKGQIDLDIFELLTENSSSYLNAIGKSYVKQISKVFASDETTFSKTEIKIELGEIADLRIKILAEKITQEIGIRNSISVKIVKKINKCMSLDQEPETIIIRV